MLSYQYLTGSQRYPICDLHGTLSNYEHIGEEIRAQTVSFIGEIHGLLHRLQLKPFNLLEHSTSHQVVYYPHLTPLQLGERVDVATCKGSITVVG